MRVRAAAGAGLTILALFGMPVAAAQAEAAATPSCAMGDLSAQAASDTPVAVSTGEAAVEDVSLTNTTSSTLTNASVILAVIPPQDTNGSGAPTMSWRFDGSSWHSFSLSWDAPAGSDADWQSPVLYFNGTFAPKSTHTLEIAASFSSDSPHGEYLYNMAYSADPCGMSALGQNMAYSSFEPGTPAPPPTTHPAAPTTPRPPRTSEPQQSSAAETAHTATSVAASPTHSATPSPAKSVTSSASPAPSTTVSPSPRTSTQTLAAVQDAAASRKSDTPSGLLLAGIGVIFVGTAFFVGRRLRRRTQR
jgi:hypothetical protein